MGWQWIWVIFFPAVFAGLGLVPSFAERIETACARSRFWRTIRDAGLEETAAKYELDFSRGTCLKKGGTFAEHVDRSGSHLSASW